jgi:predicted nucleic acid-binding protein
VEDNSFVLDAVIDILQKVQVAGKQVHDANIVATMQVHGLKHLLTHNIADFSRFSSFISVIPLEKTDEPAADGITPSADA